ncbi:hypothetical protein HPB50_017265 [Hyalomma asiaticum]|uniref:Uncharacterized protein n=1 Tax=Hyalomma asiaticum TaxID=266040 RepID=A0ACB7SWT2_HYAAI|nr:hypothetical protein HPB50_017265 [Hyalomma asiaticum]
MFPDQAVDAAHTEGVVIKRDGRIRKRKRQPSPSSVSSRALADDRGNDIQEKALKTDEPRASASFRDAGEEAIGLLSGNHFTAGSQDPVATGATINADATNNEGGAPVAGLANSRSRKTATMPYKLYCKT